PDKLTLLHDSFLSCVRESEDAGDFDASSCNEGVLPLISILSPYTDPDSRWRFVFGYGNRREAPAPAGEAHRRQDCTRRERRGDGRSRGDRRPEWGGRRFSNNPLCWPGFRICGCNLDFLQQLPLPEVRT